MDLGYLVECGIFGEHILVYFAWNELFAIEAVSRALYDAVNCESVWRRAARALFRDKMFVPARCLRLIAPGNDRNERADLRALPVKDLKARCAAYALDASACVEKADLIRLLAARESRAAQPREPLARLAVRAAVLDRRRNAITRDELCAIPWAIRLRADGGLHMLAHADPWWQGAAETGKVEFAADGQLRISFPAGADPFEAMRGHLDQLRYELCGYYVQLSIGPHEYLARHPTHWGWLLVSGATVWTRWPMPPRGQDPIVEDAAVDALVQDRIVPGFRW